MPQILSPLKFADGSQQTRAGVGDHFGWSNFGKPAANAMLDYLRIPAPLRIYGNGWGAVALVAAAGPVSLFMQRAPFATPTSFVTIATLAWATGATVPIITASDVDCGAGDLVRFYGPSAAVTALADIVVSARVGVIPS